MKTTLIQKPTTGLIATLIILCCVYLTTLQTIPNGSSHYFMIDVGETQVVLNNWGTLHATGYPLYVITGNLLTGIMVAAGFSSVTAPALVSLLWGLTALALIFALAHHLSGRVWLSAGVTILYGLTRTMWIHNVIAEIYSFTLLILVLLLVLALWRTSIPHRIYWMALVGGLGIAHHRAIAMSIPALLYAVWPQIQRTPRSKLPRLLIVSLLLGLLGLLQYAYLYLRARAGADWVYGQPGTLAGLWDEFIGTEASRFIGPPESWTAFIDNFNQVNTVLIRDLTLSGIALGIAGLIVAVRVPASRRAGLTLSILAGAAYGFHVLWYRDILSALILPITLSLAFGWLFLVDALLRHFTRVKFMLPVVFGVSIAALLHLNFTFIKDQTTDPTGLETITQLQQAPADSTVMLAWGPRYFAAAAGKLLLNDLPHFQLVNDKHNLAEFAEAGTLITPEYTFYNQPLDWWREKLGSPVFLQAAAPSLVAVGTSPAVAGLASDGGISIESETLRCEDSRLVLDVTWATETVPAENLNIFVKAFDAAGDLLAQGDQSAPVYGWRPLTTWTEDERVRDFYMLNVNPTDVTEVHYGMYRTLPDGQFENVSEYVVKVNCPAEEP